MLECLGKGSEINTIQEYIDNFEQAQQSRKWFKSLSEEYLSAVDVINVLRKLRDGNLDFHIEDESMTWSLDDGDIDKTTLVIYNQKLKLNERAKEHIEKFLDEGMYPSVLDKKVRNNEGGLIWLPAWTKT